MGKNTFENNNKNNDNNNDNDNDSDTNKITLDAEVLPTLDCFGDCQMSIVDLYILFKRTLRYCVLFTTKQVEINCRQISTCLQSAFSVYKAYIESV